MPNNKRIYTPELKAEILEMYADRNVKVIDIAKKYNMSTSNLSKLVETNGGKLRKSRKNAKEKNCFNCHRKIPLSGACFCPYCGSEILTELEKLIIRVTSLYPLAAHLPTTERDNFHAILSDVKKELEKIK